MHPRVRGPADRRTVDRSAAFSRAAAAVPRVCVRLAAGRPVLRLALGGPAAAAAQPTAAPAQPSAAQGPAVLISPCHAVQLPE